METVRYLPEWLPGGRWKRTARAWRKVVQAAGTAPVDYVMEQMVMDDLRCDEKERETDIP